MGWFRRRRDAFPPIELAPEPDEWVHVLGAVPRAATDDPTVGARATVGGPTAEPTAVAAPPPPAQAPPAAAARASVEVAPRLERAIMALAAHARQMEDRVVTLERRVDRAIDALEHLPSHEDVMDARMHSARLAADMTRMAVQLRAEIQETAAQLAGPQDQKIRQLAEQVLALWDEFESLPREPIAPPAAEPPLTGHGPGIVAIA